MPETVTEEQLEDSRWVPINKAAAELNVSEKTIRNWGLRGKVSVGKGPDKRTYVNLDTIPEADEATLLEAAVSLAREQRKGAEALTRLHLDGLKSLHSAFSQENQQLREHRDRLEKQMRLMHKTVEELGDGAVAREIAVSEHERTERRFDIGGAVLLELAAKQLGLPKESVMGAVQALVTAPGPPNGDAEPETSETPPEPDEALPAVD